MAKIGLLAALILCLLSPALRAEEKGVQRIVLPVPEKSGIPREKVTLSIRIPPKIEVQEEIPRTRKRPHSAAWDAYDFRPFKKLPRSKFIHDTLRIFAKKGCVGSDADRMCVRFSHTYELFVIPTVVRIYRKLVDVHQHNALRKLGITIEDLEKFQQVVELMKDHLDTFQLNQITINKDIEDMIAFLRKTSGKGRLRIVEVKEDKDGSTILELEILKGDM